MKIILINFYSLDTNFVDFINTGESFYKYVFFYSLICSLQQNHKKNNLEHVKVLRYKNDNKKLEIKERLYQAKRYIEINTIKNITPKI